MFFTWKYEQFKTERWYFYLCGLWPMRIKIPPFCFKLFIFSGKKHENKSVNIFCLSGSSWPSIHEVYPLKRFSQYFNEKNSRGKFIRGAFLSDKFVWKFNFWWNIMKTLGCLIVNTKIWWLSDMSNPNRPYYFLFDFLKSVFCENCQLSSSVNANYFQKHSNLKFIAETEHK